MDLRRLALLVPLILLPVPAHADRHTMEAFAGLSTEKSAAQRYAFAVLQREWCTTTVDSSDGARNWTPCVPGPGSQRKASVFVVGEIADYFVGKDSGRSLDAAMLGVRSFFYVDRRIDLFGHVLGGGQRPSRQNEGDDDTDGSLIGVLGAGVDVRLSGHARVVPVLRLQGDLVESGSTSGFHPYGRFTVGLSLRFE